MLAQEFNLSKELSLEFLDGPFFDATLPAEAKGWFALPTLDAVAKSFFPDSKDPIEIYCKATELALDKVSKISWEFENLDCKSTPEKFFPIVINAPRTTDAIKSDFVSLF